MHAMTSGGVANADAVCSLLNLLKGVIQVSLWEKILPLLVDGNLACNFLLNENVGSSSWVVC